MDARETVPAELGEEFGLDHQGADFFLIECGRKLVGGDDGGEVWKEGYEPFESQAAFHGLAHRFKGFSGPVGSGKSAALCREALRLAYLNQGCLGLIGAPTYPMLRDVTRAAFLGILDANGIPHRFLKSENAVYLTEPRAQVIFRSLDHPERLVGTNLAWFAVDELTYCKEDGWRRLEARLREPKAKRLCGFAVWTPKGFDWVYRRFVSPERVEGYEAIRAKPGENKALPADFYERLKHSYDERFFQQEALGEYLNVFSGRTYYAFERAGNVAALEFDRREALCWSMDFNVNPMCSVLAQIIGGRVHVLEELILPDSNTREACEEFAERAERYRKVVQGTSYGIVPLNVVVYGDASGDSRSSQADRTDWQIVREFFKRNGDRFRASFRVPSSNPAVKARVNAMNGLLRNHAGERRLMIDPRCKELIADLEQVAWKSDPHGNTLTQLDKSDPKRTHVSDALGYLIEKEFGLRTLGGPRSQYLGV
ncbi:MAG: terminase large subunit domain-containing protein [Bryobacteraceae bacterium]